MTARWYQPIIRYADKSGKIHMVAHYRHFMDHTAPIFLSLPPETRGMVVYPEALSDYAASLGLPPSPRVEEINKRVNPHRLKTWRDSIYVIPPEVKGPVIVASARSLTDMIALTGVCRPVIHTEHGCGLVYLGGIGGGTVYRKRQWLPPKKVGDCVNLFLVPGEQPYKIYKKAYPHAVVAKIGCPKLDVIHRKSPMMIREKGEQRVVCVSSHFDLKRTPETRSAFYHIRSGIPDLQKAGYRVVGHCHPRCWNTFKENFVELGIEPIKNFSDVLEIADVYVNDCSSTLYEFASTGKPTIAYNCPLYRKRIKHGLRFWDGIPGLMIDEPEELLGAVEKSLDDYPEHTHGPSSDLMRKVYTSCDGHATKRAVQAILEWKGK